MRFSRITALAHKTLRPLVMAVFLLLASGVQAGDFVRQLEAEIIEPIISETPGAALVVVVDGKVVLQKTWGVRRLGDPHPITPYTLFRIASLSKTFAAAAASILVEETPLSWQSPVVDSVSNLRFKRVDYGRQINLQHIMSQSTGLMPHAYTNLIEDNLPYLSILEKLDSVDFVCAPGECYAYQNVVFSLVGDLVQAHTGLDYSTFVEQKIFTPLNMPRASFGRASFLNDSNHAKPHVWTGKAWSSTRTTHHYYRVAPAAGVNASIDDMRVWLMAQLGGAPEVLSPAMLGTMQQSVIATSRHQAHYKRRRGLKNIGYGLGWRVFDYAGLEGFVQHGGYVRGMRSEMMFNPALQTGFVFLTNSEPNSLGDLVFNFIDLYREQMFEASDQTALGQ